MTGSDWPPSFPPPADAPRPLRGRVLDALIDEGLAPDVDDDGDVSFRLRGQQLFVRCVDAETGGGPRTRDGAPLARVFGQWRVSGPAPERELVRLRAANEVTSRFDLVKATVRDDVLLVVVDLVVHGEPPLGSMVRSAATGVLAAVRAWHAAAGGPLPGVREDDAGPGAGAT